MSAEDFATDQTFEQGEKVVTKRIEGVKLMVSAANAAENKEEK